jgi:general secretion pathway protein F
VTIVLFEVRAAQPGAGVVKLEIEADSVDAALTSVRARGYAALAAAPVSVARKVRRRGRFSLVLFSQELLALLSAGLSLIEGLETLAEKGHASEAGRVLQRVLECLYQGMPFSEALERQPQAFPALFVATVRASEKTGDLDEALSRYVAYETQFDVVRKKVIAASVYPVLLIAFGGLVVLFLLSYVVPRFSLAFAESTVELPFASRLLIKWGTFFSAHGGEVLIGAGVIVAAAVWLLTRLETRQRLARMLWRLPAFGERMRLYHLARFYRTLGMIQRGGIPLVTALGMAGGLLSAGLKGSLERARLAVEQGLPLSRAFGENGLTTPVAVRMLRVGERSGRMAEMLERIGSFYDEEITRWVDITSRLLEPLIMVVIGIVIGGVVLLMYMPIFELAASVQ